MHASLPKRVPRCHRKRYRNTTVCFTVCLLISPDSDGYRAPQMRLRYVSRYVCSIVPTWTGIGHPKISHDMFQHTNNPVPFSFQPFIKHRIRDSLSAILIRPTVVFHDMFHDMFLLSSAVSLLIGSVVSSVVKSRLKPSTSSASAV